MAATHPSPTELPAKARAFGRGCYALPGDALEGDALEAHALYPMLGRIVTPRLLLRPVAPSDAAWMFELGSDPEIGRFTNRPTPFSPPAAAAAVERMVESSQSLDAAVFAIEADFGGEDLRTAPLGAAHPLPLATRLHAATRSGPERAIGTISLYRASHIPEPVPPAGVVELGYWMGAPHRRLGLAAEALAALSIWYLAGLHPFKVIPPAVAALRIRVDNLASQATAKRCGYLPAADLFSVPGAMPGEWDPRWSAQLRAWALSTTPVPAIDGEDPGSDHAALTWLRLSRTDGRA